MAIHKGDKVRSTDGGPLMDVLASSGLWAICEWHDGGRLRAELFETTRLAKVSVQQAQQPQPPESGDGAA